MSTLTERGGIHGTEGRLWNFGRLVECDHCGKTIPAAEFGEHLKDEHPAAPVRGPRPY